MLSVSIEQIDIEKQRESISSENCKDTGMRRYKDEISVSVREVVHQCDLIGRFLKVLGVKFYRKSSPNIWRLSGLF